MTFDREALRGLASRLGPDLSGYGVHLSLTEPSEAQDLVAVSSAAPTDAFRWTFVARDVESMTAHIWASIDMGRLIYTVRVDGEVVGQTGFYDLEWWTGREAPDVVEVGHTWYVDDRRGTHVNPACKLLLFTHAFETWRVSRIGMRTDSRNARSRNAMLKLGMTFEGIRRHHMMGADGMLRDSAYFSAVYDEWPAIKQGLLARLS